MSQERPTGKPLPSGRGAVTYWHVVQTKPQGELKAADELEAIGLPTLAPSYVRVSQHSRRRVERKEPHMRRYIAVAADTETVIWREIGKAKHVTRPLMAGERIARLRPREVDGMRGWEGVQPAQERGPTYRLGQVVRVTEGPFLGFSGPLAHIGKAIARVELQYLGAMREIPVPISAVEAA